MAFYDSIRLEKGMYAAGKSFTQVLEELDPSENYRNTELEGLDAYQRQLKRFDIKVGGAASDTVSKFFQTSDSAALFPEYVSRAVRQGIERNDIISDIIAAKTVIEGMDYRSVVSVPGVEEKSLKPVSEGAALPTTTIKTSESLVKLQKRGRMLVASYEAVKFQKLDLFTVTLRQIGAYIARQQLDDAVNVIVSGDGSNGAAQVVNAASSGSLSYDDLVKLWAELSPYELNTILAPTDAMKKLLDMKEMKDSHAGLEFHGSGRMITPLGAKLMHTKSIPSGKLIGLDKTCALEMVQSGGIITDHDKLIDRQLERASISCITGFAKIFPDSAKVLEY